MDTVFFRWLMVGVVLCANAAAQTYPAGPIRIISPYPPGGGTDLLARAIAQRITERYNVPDRKSTRLNSSHT